MLGLGRISRTQEERSKIHGACIGLAIAIYRARNHNIATIIGVPKYNIIAVGLTNGRTGKMCARKCARTCHQGKGENSIEYIKFNHVLEGGRIAIEDHIRIIGRIIDG